MVFRDTLWHLAYFLILFFGTHHYKKQIYLKIKYQELNYLRLFETNTFGNEILEWEREIYVKKFNRFINIHVDQYSNHISSTYMNGPIKISVWMIWYLSEKSSSVWENTFSLTSYTMWILMQKNVVRSSFSFSISFNSNTLYH